MNSIERLTFCSIFRRKEESVYGDRKKLFKRLWQLTKQDLNCWMQQPYLTFSTSINFGDLSPTLIV